MIRIVDNKIVTTVEVISEISSTVLQNEIDNLNTNIKLFTDIIAEKEAILKTVLELENQIKI